MFLGTTPREHSAVLLPAIREWKVSDLAFPCAGNFTIPRSLIDLGRRFHANDVTLYSCCLGNHFAGRPTEITLNPDAGVEWMTPYLESSIGQAATLMVWSGFATAWRKRNQNPYYGRIAAAAKAQFPALHAKAVSVLQKSKLQLASFFAGDCVDFLDTLPAECGVVSYPPIYAKGYERLWKDLEDQLRWTPPAYELFTDERLELLIRRTMDRPHWAILTHHPIEALRDTQWAQVKITNRSPSAYFYGSEQRRAIVAPHQKVVSPPIPRVIASDSIEGPLQLMVLSAPLFCGLRSAYMNADIPPGQAALPIAVLLGGKIAGAFAFGGASNVSYKGVPEPIAYLLSDFAVHPGPDRLAKLIVGAALSREARMLLERQTSLRFRSLVTTAFSNNPMSMKYRGMMKLLTRTEVKDDTSGPFKFKLSYGGPFGEHTLEETLKRWKGKHAAPHRAR